MSRGPRPARSPGAKRRGTVLAAVGGGCLLLFGACGAGLGAIDNGSPSAAVTATVAAAPLPTVTRTAAAPEPVLLEVPAQTSTAAAPPPVVAPAPTVYVDAPPAPVPLAGGAAGSSAGRGSSAGGSAYYANCAAARAAGAAPILQGEPGYSRKLDRDGDGVACES